MNIVKLYGKDLKSIVAVQIEDDGLKYPVYLKSLHTKVIFDNLLASGWKLTKYPFGFMKGNVKLKDLPLEDRKFTEDEEQEMLDINAATSYTIDSIKSKIDREDLEKYQFLKGSYLIKTREEFLEYLEAYDRSGGTIDVETSYLPLNSFVSPNARFSLEEYFSSEYSKYRWIIEARRNLTYPQYKKLEALMKSQAPDVKITMKTFCDFYFQWGFCGINLDLYERKETQIEYNLSAPRSSYYNKEEHRPYLYRKEYGYFDYTGTITVPKYPNSKGWTPTGYVVDVQKACRSLEPGQVVPIVAEVREKRNATEFIGNNTTIIYDETLVYINYNAIERYMPTLRIFIGKDMVPFKYVGASKEASLFEYLENTALAKMIEQKSILKTTASSYNALQSVGLSPFSALIYAIYRGNIMEVINSSDDLETENLNESLTSKKKTIGMSGMTELDVAKNVRDYIEGTMPKEHPQYDIIEEFVLGFLAGTINIDDTASGSVADNTSKTTEYYQSAISIARDVLGMDYLALKEKIESLCPGDISLSLSNEGKSMTVNIYRKDNTLKGYKADRQKYVSTQANTASCYGYVTDIYRELGPEGAKLRHVGVEVKFINTSQPRTASALKSIMSLLESEQHDRIANHIPLSQQEIYFEATKLAVIKNVFSIGLNGYYVYPEALGGGRIEVGEDTVATVRRCFEQKVDSTVNFSDNTVNPYGNFAFYCVNAVITPYWVIPKTNFTIREVSLAPMWVNTVGEQFDALRKRWYESGNIPSLNFYGNSYDYDKTHIPRTTYVDEYGKAHAYDVRIDRRGLYCYYKKSEQHIAERRGKYKLTVCPHPFESYPTIAFLDEDKEDVKIPAEKDEKCTYCVGVPRLLTRELLFKENPELKQIFEPASTDSIEEVKYIRPFLSFSAIDFFYAKNIESLKITKRVEGKESLIRYACGVAIFSDGKRMSVDDIPNYADTGDYKIISLSGRHYLIEDIKGELWEAMV